MKTLLLDRDVWDLVLDASGNIAVASDPYSIAQDVASAIRTFAGECWYDTSLGVPHFGEIIGQWPPLVLVKSRVVEAALKVPGVVSAQCLILSLTDRTLTGQVQIIDTTGAANNVNF